MGVIERSSLFSNLACHLHVKRNGQKGLTARAKKPGDLPENSKAQQLHIFTLRVPTPVFARSAVAMFGLGFVDAGYCSGIVETGRGLERSRRKWKTF
uniref:DUF7887 domain-containing protein n=1 Tax=Rhizophora mucronata TaxID=61149 RepID=A0A2P2JBZ5_RHIMU